MSDNKIIASRDGILIWSEQLPTTTDSFLALDGIYIDNNNIDLHPHQFEHYPIETDDPDYVVGRGVYIVSGKLFTTAKNINIINNNIEYFDGPNFNYSLESGTSFAAIGGFNFNYSFDQGEKNAAVIVDTINVSNNTISNCENSAVSFYLGKINNITVKDNTFDSCNSGSFPTNGGRVRGQFTLYIANQLSGNIEIFGNTFDNTPGAAKNIYIYDRSGEGTLIANETNGNGYFLSELLD